MGYEKIINHKEFTNCLTKINKWYLRKSKILNIITSPYNSTLIYSSIINEIARKGGNILYIWGNNSPNDELIKEIKLKDKGITYSYIEKGESEKTITFTSFKNMINVRGEYDLCIIDDISKFSLMNKDELIELIEAMYIYSKRIIVYSIERIVSMGEKVEISSLISNKPYVEPRILNTRIKLDDDIPYSLYDYLLWFRDNKSKVIIYAPTEEKARRVYKQYSNTIKISGAKFLLLLRDGPLKELESSLKIKDKGVFIITNYFGDYLKAITELNIVALFSDNRFYSYKKIIYLCAEAGKNPEKHGEILLVSRDISNDMEEAKKFSRNLNKKIWEKGLLRY
ncbi:hypothetical protein [Clostridium chauvoei]|uniref:Comf operon protein A, DNA transporter ATPase n=2 Tax=Clostridium chauvoei TaxID=46867 RepID=A0A1U6JPX4_9CLOT|nr:hypothetical protein [Clostridium chauvoei]ATD55911.1 hypothetical protein BTM20_11990 [Clostridium chauvoei]ATD56416.1 hypothetical protein BTM21_01025 [Clostridium chauvoei]MBX7281118.1 hypothetical protein [Clostridium chauvoei]MBX7283600.1 hypothetical protein [Clostridium chauvoei]MBX7286208.1 hypothetical protein [Clostridium chauvoei]